MRPLTLLPLLSLVGALVLLAIALRPAEPLEVAYQTAHQGSGDRIGKPVLPLGEVTLEGRLESETGEPIAGATVFLVQRGRPLWTSTDAEGHFRLDELDRGPVRLAITHQAYPATEIETTVGAGDVTLRMGPRRPPPPVVPRARALDLEGTARVPGIDDLSGYEVALLPTAPADRLATGIPRRVDVDREGHFSIPGLEAAEYQIMLLPPEAHGGTWPDLLTPLDGPPLLYVHPPDAGHPPEAGPIRPLELVAISGEIGGLAHGARGVELLEGAMVYVTPLGGDVADARHFPPVLTDEVGEYHLRHLPPGRYRVILRAGADRREVEVSVPPQSTVDPDF